MMNLEAEIKAAICDQLGLKPSQVLNNKKFIADLGADSMEMVSLLMTIEERLDLVILDEDAEKMETVQDVIDYVVSKKSAK